MRRVVLSGSVLVVYLLLMPAPVCSQSGRKDPDDAAKEFRVLLEKTRERYKMPALAAATVGDAEHTRMAVVGVRKRGTTKRVTLADQWHLGSNTKPMTGLLIALLVDAGLLDWDTSLERIFPEYAGRWSADMKKITPAHLLTHTSGLPANWPGDWWKIPSQGLVINQRAIVMKNLAAVKLMSKPGEKFEYSNLGYVVLGAIIDRRGKASWEKQLESRIFRPLGIKQWSLGPVGRNSAIPAPWPHHDDGRPGASDSDNPPILNSAGRVRLSIGDYNRFLAEYLRLARGEKGLLKPATAEKMFTNPYPASSNSLSGWFGFRKEPGARGLYLNHNGCNNMNFSTAIVIPDRNLAVCVLTNQGTPDTPLTEACVALRDQLWGRKK